NPAQQQRQRANELTINMTVEALVLTGVDKRDHLLPGVDKHLLLQDVVTTLEGGPAGFALIPWAIGITGPLGPRHLAPEHREYAAIGGKNIFYGAAPVDRRRDSIDVTQFVYLSEITKTVSRTEAK